MKPNINIEMTAQEILCWIAMGLIAWNPGGAFNTFFEQMGVKLPFLMAASGAGSKFAKGAIDSMRGGQKQ